MGSCAIIRPLFHALIPMFAAACLASPAVAAEPEPHHGLDEMIAHYARIHGIPDRLVHRVVVRESRYNPSLVHRRFYGLMQITYATARTMGYRGAPRGLLDPETNLAYAVPYLANAYKTAGGDENRAVALYAAGYYYVAKHKKLLGEMRTAQSPSLEPPPPPPPAPVAVEPPNPVTQLLQFVSHPEPSAEPAVAASPAPAAPAAVEPVPAAPPVAEAAAAPLVEAAAVPLPPARPPGLASHK